MSVLYRPAVMRASNLLLTLVVTGALALPAAPAHATGAFLLWGCRYAVDPDPHRGPSEQLQMGYCEGFVKGVIDTSALYESNGAKPAPLRCVPDDYEPADAFKGVRDYLETHKEELDDEDEVAVVVRALQATYPCKNK